MIAGERGTLPSDAPAPPCTTQTSQVADYTSGRSPYHDDASTVAGSCQAGAGGEEKQGRCHEMGAAERDPSTAATIRSLLGDGTVLIPTPPGEKGPRIRDWQSLTRERTRAPEFEQQLEGGDIAILLGPPSANLIDIDLDSDALAEEFLRLNPGLEATLRTRGSKGGHFFLRMSGDYPASVIEITGAGGEHVGEFRGGGGVTKVAGTHPSGCRYSIINGAHPLDMALAEIRWPEDWKAPGVIPDPHDELVRLAGPAFAETRAGVALNGQYSSHLFARSVHVVYDEGEGRFYIWDPATGIWVPRSLTELREALYGCFRDWVAAQDPAIQARLRAKATRRFGDDAVEILKGVASERDFFAPRPGEDLRGHMVACANGALLVVLDEVVGPIALTPDLRLRHLVPHPFDPKAGCQGFLQMLAKVAESDMIDLLQRVVGSMLVPLNRAQQVTVITGPTSSAKGTLLRVLTGLLGEDRVGQLRTEQLEGRFELGALADCTHLFAPDAPPEFLSEKGARMLKALVGGDLFRGELKYSNARVKIRGEFHVLIDTNHRLAIPAGDDPAAWRRRLVIVEFSRSIPEHERRPGFAQGLLRDEARGILAWAVEGARRAAGEIERYGRLVLNDAQQALVNRAVRLPGKVEDFVRQRVARGAGDLTTAELTEAYATWCEGGGLVAESAANVAKQLAQSMPAAHGVHLAHNIMREGKSANGYRGVVPG